MVAMPSVFTGSAAAAAAVVKPGRRLLIASVPVLPLLLLIDYLPKCAMVSAFDIDDLSEECQVQPRSYINDGYCDGGEYNTEECSYDGEDCDAINAEFEQTYPGCSVTPASKQVVIGDGYCDEEYNTKACQFDGGDCDHANEMSLQYPKCSFELLELVGNGYCDVGQYNTEACGWDGGDCAEGNEIHKAMYPDCIVTNPQLIENKYCNGILDGDDYNTKECGWDGGDCLAYNEMYPKCNVTSPERLNNTFCNDEVEGYNTEECGWDGGDCILYNSLTNCTVEEGDFAHWIGDGHCDCKYNTTECGQDGGDCQYAAANCSCAEDTCSSM